MNANLHNKESDFKNIQKAFSDAIRDPVNHPNVAGIDQRHMNVYRELFFNNVEGFISGGFPVLMELFSEEQQIQLVRDFFIKHNCHSPYFLKISEEFLEYLLVSELDFLPEFSYQLAHWEWMELYADVYKETQSQAILTELDFEADIISITQSAWCQAYDYPVHKISSENHCEPKVSYLMVYRNPQLEVGFIEINPLSALLYERLKENTCKSADGLLQHIAIEQNMDTAQVVQGGRQILEHWAGLGLLILASS